jgi:D-arabinose 1-dehydrogenase-like Zn-dependent alcohol dehydrogenase
VSLVDDDVEIALEAVQVGTGAGVGRPLAGEDRGRAVLVGPIDACGECDVCRRGGAAVCPTARRRGPLGATVATVTASRRWLVPLGDGLDLPMPAAAAVAGDVALAYTLYARTGLGPREPVVVVGACPVARFLVEILLAKGIAPAAITEPGSWADWLAAKSVTVVRDRAALCEVFAAQGLGTRPWRILCADPATAASAAALAGPRATLTVLAAPSPGALAGDLLAREVVVLGVAGAHPDLVVEAAAMCARGEVDLIAGTTDAPDALRAHVRPVR